MNDHIIDIYSLGTIAAWWQGTAYGGLIPPGSVFAWGQHLGTVVGRRALGV